jgi:hypothetical protein
MPRPLEVAPGAPVGRAALATLALTVVVGVAPRPAHANGAFPESYQIVLPADRPGQIVLATNFGLIISDDDGASWNWTCEQKATAMGTLYGVAAAPLHRFFSMSMLVGLAYSNDDSCTWTSSGGSLDTILATDYFADPTNPMRVYAEGKVASDDSSAPRVVTSDDGGQTFGAPIYTAAAGHSLSGIESARSAPQTLYLASYVMPTTTTYHPFLERSTDGGASWTEIDAQPSLGANSFRIIAVDPNDANVLTVRVIEQTGESLAISRDGGMTFTKMFMIAGQLTAYVRLDSGTILVAGALAIDGVGYRSTDGGMTFTDWTPRTTSDAGVPDIGADGGAARPPHLRALAARGGKLYAAAKNFSDDWAIGVSTDEGATFERLARYDEVGSIRPCVQATCLESCKMQAVAQVWPLPVCHAPIVTPPAPKTGGGCVIGPAGAASGVALPVVLGFLAALCVARARRR